jgi:hypothetical protein
MCSARLHLVSGLLQTSEVKNRNKAAVLVTRNSRIMKSRREILQSYSKLIYRIHFCHERFSCSALCTKIIIASYELSLGVTEK